MDFFLIDTCGRAKIRCCVSNCYGYSSDWTTDILLCLQYGHSSTCSWSNLVAKVAGEKGGGGDGGLVSESVDGVKMSAGTPDFPNAALAMKDWEDKKERKTYSMFSSCAVWTFWILTCTLGPLQLWKSRLQVLSPHSADKTIKWKVAIFTQYLFWVQ